MKFIHVPILGVAWLTMAVTAHAAEKKVDACAVDHQLVLELRAQRENFETGASVVMVERNQFAERIKTLEKEKKVLIERMKQYEPEPEK